MKVKLLMQHFHDNTVITLLQTTIPDSTADMYMQSQLSHRGPPREAEGGGALGTVEHKEVTSQRFIPYINQYTQMYSRRCTYTVLLYIY